MPDITTRVAGINLENPFTLASGILDENGYTMKRILMEGASAVVTKSIGSKPRSGYRPPVVSEAADGIINAVGLANPGIDNFGNEMEIARLAGKPIIGSIFGSTVEEFVNLAKRMELYSAAAVELNLSCPHVEGVGLEIGGDPDLVEEIVTETKRAVRIPVLAKLSPNVTDMLKIAKAAEKADAYVLINTVKGMAIDVYAKMPVLSNSYGGLSGKAIKPVGLRYVYQVKKETGKEIMGVGGIDNAIDAVEYLMAGASAVQIGTALYRHGRKIFGDLIRNLQEFMKAEGYETIRELVGMAIKR